MNKNSSAFLFSVFAILMAIVAMYVATTRMPVASDAIPGAGAINDLSTLSNPYYFSNSIFGVKMASTTQVRAKIGVTGTQLTNVVETTCAANANSSIAASSTGYMFCTGISGLTSADTNIVAEFSTSSLPTLPNDNFWIVAAKASTTAGAVDLKVYNATGVAVVPAAVSRIASTTVIHASH